MVTLHQAGFDNAVASMGTALTVEQTRLLSRYTKELVPLLRQRQRRETRHGARAAASATTRNSRVKVLQLPRRMVDGELIKQDADDFIKYQGARRL